LVVFSPQNILYGIFRIGRILLMIGCGDMKLIGPVFCGYYYMYNDSVKITEVVET